MVGQFGNDDPLSAAPYFLDGRGGLHHDTAAPGGVGVEDAGFSADVAGSGEIRAFDEIHQPVGGAVGVIDEVANGVANLPQIMGRNVGGHTNRDTRCSVDHHIGHAGRQNPGLLDGIVEIQREVDRVVIDVGQQFFGYIGQPRFGVTHRCRRVAVDAAKVALSVDQWVAQGKWLGHAYQGVVHGGFSVRVELPQYFPGDTSAFTVG